MTNEQFRPTSDSLALQRLLAEVEVGGEISYVRLSEAIGRNVQTEARGVLDTARNRLLRDQRRVFEVVVNLGLRRLDDRGIVQTSDRVRAHIRRTARKGAQTVLCSDYEALDRETQIKHNTALSVLAVTEMMTSERAAKRIEHEVAKTGVELPGMMAATLALSHIS